MFINKEELERTIRSQVDKTANKIRSEFQSQLAKVKNEYKDNDQIDYLENVIKFISDKAGYKVYKVKPTIAKNIYSNLYFSNFSSFSWESEAPCKEVSIEELPKLGTYTTFTVGEDTYVIAKAKKEKKVIKKK